MIEGLLPLAPRARVLFYLQSFARFGLFWVPVTCLGMVAGAWFWDPLNSAVIGLIWLFVLFLSAVWMPAIAHARYGYAVGEREVRIARGVLVKSVVAIPRGRVQHVDMRQGPIEQWMGLARIQIHTASGLGGDGVIPGLELADAERLRDELVVVEGDDGV